MKTIVAVLLTQFDLAIVDPPTTTTTTTAAAASMENTRGVFDTREAQGPGINGARAGELLPNSYFTYHLLLVKHKPYC